MRLLQSLATKLPPVYEQHTDVVRDDSIRIVRLIATWLEAMGGYPKCYSQALVSNGDWARHSNIFVLQLRRHGVNFQEEAFSRPST